MNDLDLITLNIPLVSDAFSLYNCIDRNRPFLTNLAWSQTATEDSTREFLREVKKLYPKEDFRLILQNGLVVVGAVTLRDTGDELQLGYWLDNGLRGKGVMPKCVTEILRDANKPVSARVRIGNWASRRVLIKCGFVGTAEDCNEWITYHWFPGN